MVRGRAAVSRPEAAERQRAEQRHRDQRAAAIRASARRARSTRTAAARPASGIRKISRDVSCAPSRWLRRTGAATRRFSRLPLRATTSENADAPHAGAHEVHAEQARHQEVDVARARLGHLGARRGERDRRGPPPAAARHRRPAARCGSRAASDRRRTSACRRRRRPARPGRGRAPVRLPPPAGSRGFRSAPPDKAASRASACGPATTATGSASGGLLRKARPRTAASTIGNTKTQNTASGSRVSSRMRAQRQLHQRAADRIGLCAVQPSRSLRPVRAMNTSSSVA